MNYWIDRCGFLWQSTPDGVSLWRYTGAHPEPWEHEMYERWPTMKPSDWLKPITSVEAGEYIAAQKREART